MRAVADRRLRLTVAAALFVGAVALFWPVTSAEFVNFDDPDYVTANAVVRKGLTLEGVRWAFGGFHLHNWHPLSLLSHMADVELYGSRPKGHHLTSLLLHAVNALLLFLVLHGYTGALWRCAVTAALFAVHPLHVESVAWVSERKDVLSTLFFVVCLGAYLRRVRRPGGLWYPALVLFYGAGLMAKPMLVTLPLVLLLLDFWPLGRAVPMAAAPLPGLRELCRSSAPLVREKLPLFALAIASAGVTFLAQKSGGSVGTLEEYPLGVRVLNALISSVDYVGKMLWPRDLALIYPHPGAAVSTLKAAGAGVLLAVATLAALAHPLRRPAAAAGWLWYLVTLVPVIGLVQVGQQAMADRYTYIPLTGLFLAAVWLAGDCARHRRAGAVVAAAGAAAITLALAPVTRAQIGVWSDGVRLFTHALAVTGGNATIRNNLGTALAARGRPEEALPHLLEAARLDPRNPRYRFNLANAFVETGRLEAAVASYRTALELKPDYSEARTNLAVALARLGRFQEAVGHLEEALRGDPGNERGHYNLGMVLKASGRGQEAAAHFRSALRIAPGFDAARQELEGLAWEGRAP